ncbi:MAG: hypothetical protein WD942_09575, partial [Dehalococcoidia bacterium]
MTARVNLLPAATRADASKVRQRGLAIGVLVLVIVALGVATFLQRGVLSTAEDELADAQSELAAAQAEVAALAEFQDLDARLTETNDLVTAVLGSEATLAGVLQDIALVTPTDGAFTSMQLTFEHDDPANVGTFSGQAEVLQSHAPGVERFLLQLERPAGFRNAYPGGSSIDEDDIATFPVTVQLGPEYR